MINSILHWRGYLEWRSRPSTSQKNAKSQPHLPLLSGLQHLRSTMIDSIDLCSKWSQVQPQETGDMASKRPVSSCCRQETTDLTAKLIVFFFIASRVQSDATHCTRREVYTEPPHRTRTHFSRANTTAHHPHVSSVGTPQWLKVKMSRTSLAGFPTSSSFRDVVVECTLSSGLLLLPQDPQRLPHPLQEVGATAQARPLAGVSLAERLTQRQTHVQLPRRLWLFPHSTSRSCRCGRPLDTLGHHRAACAWGRCDGRPSFRHFCHWSFVVLF